jgi:FkbM family methyltransferase
MEKESAAGKASVFLSVARIPFRATRMVRGSRFVDWVPPRVLGGALVWVKTDAGPLVLRVRDHGSRQLLLSSRLLNETEETEIVRTLLPSAHGMLDIGASYGWYTRIASNVMHPKAQKIAVEANPAVADCLRLSLSGVPGVRVLNLAATDQAGIVRFHCAPASNLSSAVRDVGTPTAVEGRPVDDIWPGGHDLDFVKCDVEGGELSVLRGARRIRKAHEPVWMLEFNERLLAEAGTEPAELAEEASDLLCWWRSDHSGWVLAESLASAVGVVRTCKNVFLVPPVRADQFAQAMRLAGKGLVGRPRARVTGLRLQSH